MTVARPSAASSLSAASRRRQLLLADLQQAMLVGMERVFDRDHPRFYRALRRHHPVARFRWPVPMTAVSRREDVLTVLSDPQTFEAAYGPHLPGPFVLGLEGKAHDRYAAELREVIRAEDAPYVGRLAAETARLSLNLRWPRGTLDVGSDVVHPALDLVIAEYLGIPGPDEQPNRRQQTQWQWAEDMFEDIFLNSADKSTIRERAKIASDQMGAHVGSLVAARRRTESGLGDDVLGRLLKRQNVAPTTALNDDEVVFSMIGLAIGWLWHGARAALIAVDTLLDDPVKLAEARRAAQDTEDPDRLRRVLWETLRFRPVQPFLLRTCTRDTVIAPGTDHERRVSRETLLAVGTHSAMWDTDAIPCPDRYDTTRSDDQYLIFGRGAHACLGEPIARVQLPALLRPLLQIDGLQRAKGSAGRLRWSGPRPVGLKITWPG
jgi:cytochrome P450